MTHWTNDVLVGFDTETTGTDPRTARILQAAIVTLDLEGVMQEEPRVLYIDPGEPIPPDASAIHGITAEVLREKMAWKSRDGIEYICNILQSRTCNRGYPCVIYNTPYDWPLLMAECARHGIQAFKPPMFLDPLVIDRALDKYRKGSRKLADTALFYRVELKGAHGAQADATATLGIMQALIKAYPQLKTFDLPIMQKMQSNWYREWRDHINDFWARTGNVDRITGEWPGK